MQFWQMGHLRNDRRDQMEGLDQCLEQPTCPIHVMSGLTYRGSSTNKKKIKKQKHTHTYRGSFLGKFNAFQEWEWVLLGHVSCAGRGWVKTKTTTCFLMPFTFSLSMRLRNPWLINPLNCQWVHPRLVWPPSYWLLSMWSARLILITPIN